MQRKVHQLLFCISFLAIVIIISAQSTHKTINEQQPMPAELAHELDSLHNANNLEDWLYAFRSFVHEDPAARIQLLSFAQKNAWRKPDSDGEREQWFNCIATQGYYQLYNGNILKSIDAYEQAYQFYLEKPLAQFNVLEYILKPLGNNYTRLGDYDRALLIQEKSLAIAVEQDSTQIASICHNLATTAIWKDSLLLAKQYCDRGLKHVKKNASLHGLLMSTLAEIQHKSGRTEEAEQNCKTAISILSGYLLDENETNAAYWLRGAWQGLGDIQQSKEQYPAALGSYKKGIAIIDRYYGGNRKREKAKLLVSAGAMLLQIKEPHKALEHFNMALSLMMPHFKADTLEALPNSKDLYGENTLLDALHGKADGLFMMNKKREALDCYMLLYTIDKKLRIEFFSKSAKQQQLKESRLWSESAIDAAFDLWKETGTPIYAEKVLQIAELSKAQLLLDEMKNALRYNRIKSNDSLLLLEEQLVKAVLFYEKEAAGSIRFDSAANTAKNELQIQLSLIQKQMKAKYPLQENLINSETVPSTDSLLLNIEPGTTVLEFFTGATHIYCIEAVRNSIVQIRKIEHAAAALSRVRDFTETYFQSGAANMMNNPEGYYKDAYEIYQLLLNGTKLSSNKSCIIIPDAVLGYLPFDALVTDSIYTASAGNWPFLINQTNLYFNYSLQTLMQQKNNVRKAGPFAGFFMSFDSSRGLSLPAVKKEYEKVESVVKGRYFREQDATIAAFNKQLKEVNLLHISTHSFLQGNENIPVLQLADGRFFLFELYGKLFQPQLVVLSACRTGHGMLAKGEGIISLARGFTAAGAGGIVAGMWDMNDETTASLMGSFYALLKTGASPADALYQAKQQWLKKQDLQAFQKLPYYWAGMVYSGDNREVKLTEKDKYSTWWLILIALLVTGLIFVMKKQGLFLK